MDRLTNGRWRDWNLHRTRSITNSSDFTKHLWTTLVLYYDFIIIKNKVNRIILEDNPECYLMSGNVIKHNVSLEHVYKHRNGDKPLHMHLSHQHSYINVCKQYFTTQLQKKSKTCPSKLLKIITRQRYKRYNIYTATCKSLIDNTPNKLANIRFGWQLQHRMAI